MTAGKGRVFTWLIADDDRDTTAPRRLGQPRRQLVGAARCVSTASVLEIAALHVAGCLHFTQPAERWIRESIARVGFRGIGLDTGIAIDAGLIPSAALTDRLVRIEIRQDVFRTSHFLFALGAIGVPGLLFGFWQWSYERRRWKNSDQSDDGDDDE